MNGIYGIEPDLALECEPVLKYEKAYRLIRELIAGGGEAFGECLPKNEDLAYGLGVVRGELRRCPLFRSAF